MWIPQKEVLKSVAESSTFFLDRRLARYVLKNAETLPEDPKDAWVIALIFYKKNAIKSLTLEDLGAKFSDFETFLMVCPSLNRLARRRPCF